MGKCRCISKPIKRFCFSYADKIADKWCLIVIKKYTHKYINKRNKLGLDNNIYDDAQIKKGIRLSFSIIKPQLTSIGKIAFDKTLKILLGIKGAPIEHAESTST